ncbi:LEAF RUST 10 DISEASE-RESISTANCE LOCUS RECEPTOR-LIKE PROTEIN KINASE-like 1.1 isoform X4 [Macadamia integrifolia]|uniref:LEAF RUST 10 DISEASE-RESISTANCE LOCUS RECEPTOR-LIKE PROTEIN KINASE-like 1.1 isoform X4 n=1 Tax=Macadamia integrifolia TaxID=60698 RepID=UPI001C4E6F41|nr:LEAF RUST 10 DISEASE-RESISTANCE LOCUS RECEPTOR-LIKE PROTEIN KINASE-like 1.1 isoform X4 [Macadamia integrifolia]
MMTATINQGFEVQWTADVNHCLYCKGLGGSCGYNWTSCQPICFHYYYARGMSLGTKFAIAAACFVVLLVFSFLVYIIYRRRRHPKEGLFTPFRSRSSSISTGPLSRKYLSNASMKDLEKGSTYFGVHVFTYAELEEATNNFNSNKELGDGGFGTVYHGKLRDGREVAVKRLYENNYRRVEQFMNEVEILNRLRHQNLVTLYGCTSRHSRELLLVYEYIPNGTVADHLHGDRAEAGSLTWPTRMSIAIETASALAYLHASDVIHRDVKTTNILLDSNFGVKVADFGLSRLFPNDVTHVSTAPQGTPGYVDPEYHQCYQLTDKSDVYSFGVVLVELISSKPAVDMNRHHNEINLANMAISKIQNQALHELVDTSLGYESDYAVKMMTTSVAELAFRCLQLEKEMRPSMDEVLETLKGIDKEDYKVEKADLVIQKDNVGLLKSIDPPFSPDSVTDKWVSRSTTPNTSA